jgi:hypothetical protein
MKLLQSTVIVAIVLMPALAVAQGTPEQKNACMGDAFQFCGDYIPDATRIEACLRKNIKSISPACGAQFRPRTQRAKAQIPPSGLTERHQIY